MPALSFMSLTLPPAQNAVPAPVRITQRMSGSRRTRSQASTTASH